MAIVRPGPLVQGISGSVGGVTFASGRATHTVRHRPKHRTATTPEALAARAHLTTQMLTWGTLSATDKLAWKNAALQFSFVDALGQRRQLSSFQLYVKMNAYPTEFDFRARIPTGPTTTSPLTLTFTAEVKPGDIEAHLTYQGPEDSNVLIYGRRSFHQYPTKPRKAFKFLSATASKPATVDLTTIWVATFGNATLGEYLEIEVFTIAFQKFPSFRLRAGTIVIA